MGRPSKSSWFHKISRRYHCTRNVFITWAVTSTIAAAIYSVVLFVTLNQKDIRGIDEAPLSLPPINTPSQYKSFLDFNIDYDNPDTTFSGNVSLSFFPKEETQRLYLNCGENLRIQEFGIYLNGEKIAARKGAYNRKSEIQAFVPKANFSLDQDYEFQATFTGQLNDYVRHFMYETENAEIRHGIVMSHERSATKGLRYLFPSFDTRDYPSKFEITVRRKAALRLLTNFVVTTSNSNVQGTMDDYVSSDINLLPMQLVLVLTDLPHTTHTMNGIEISIYYRNWLLKSVNGARLQQFMDVVSLQIGKLDAVVIPDQKTVNQPGISILNEKETIAENEALQFLEEQGLTY